MQGSHLVAALLAGVLVGGGVWIGATVFGGGDAPPAPMPAPMPASEPPAPTLGGGDLEAVNRRLGAIENRIQGIEDLIAEKTKQLEPMMSLFEQAKASGMVSEDGTPLEGAVPLPEAALEVGAEEVVIGPEFARVLGQQLGLDASRKKALNDAVDGIIEKVKALEKENASVKREGDTTTITIGTFDGGTLKRDWEDWVARNLTADEQAKVKDQHATNRLFGQRLGDFERTIKIKEAGGFIDVREQCLLGEDMPMEAIARGPAAARDMMLEPYAHLLK